MSIIEFNFLLPKVFERLTYGPVTKYSWQNMEPGDKDPAYHPPYCKICRRMVRCDHTPPLTQEDLRIHFEQKPWKMFKNSARVYSGLSIAGGFAGNRTKWLMIDMDSPLACELIRQKFIPVLDQLGIDWLWEHSGRKGFEKAHLFTLMDCPLPAQRSLIKILLEKAGLGEWQKWKLDHPDFAIEFFPYQHDKNPVRMPGSVHLRSGNVNCCTYKGVKSNDPLHIMRAIVAMKVLSSEDVANLIMSMKPEYESKVKMAIETKNAVGSATKRAPGGERFSYFPLNLKLPDIPVVYPRTVRKMFSNCQAMNELWTRTVEKNFLSKGGDDTHKWGLMVDSFALYDKLSHNADDQKGKIADEFERYTYEELRDRDFDGHNWDSYKAKFVQSPGSLIPPCKKMEANFGLCGGCKFRGQPNFSSPIEFITGSPIALTYIKKINAVSNEFLRQQEFPLVRQNLAAHVLKSKRFGGAPPRDVVWAYHQGSGKSQSGDELVAYLSHAGASTLIATPDSQLALQHKKNIESMGQKCKVLFSFKKLFSDAVREAIKLPFDCPSKEEITGMLDVFPDSSKVKSKYCNKCPFKQQCPYPGQYQQVASCDEKVIIMQHAHLGARSALMKILNKGYDTLMIDESFVDSCFFEYQADASDLAVLEFLAGKYRWMRDIYQWITMGGFPPTKIDPEDEELIAVYELFKNLDRKYILPELIQCYQEGQYYHPQTGLEQFHPVPKSSASLRLFTDATAPLEYLQVILNNPNIEVLGEEYLLNIRNYHPQNEYHQVIDGSTSVKRMSQPGYLQALLRHACTKMSTSYEGMQGLITTYKDLVPTAQEFIYREYPQLVPRVEVSHMQIGTNKYQHLPVQFLMASRYPNARELARESWKLAQIWNHWVRQTGACLSNPDLAQVQFWDIYSPGGSFDKEQVPLEYNYLTPNGPCRVQLPEMFRSVPRAPMWKLGAKKYQAIKQQSNRMRYSVGKWTSVWDYDRMPTDLLVTQLTTMGSIVNQVTENPV